MEAPIFRPETQNRRVVLLVGFFAFLVIMSAAILALVGGLQWFSKRGDEPLPGAGAERLERLESAMASLEARLDELQDQQRFLERLLAERPERRSIEAGDAESGPGPTDVDSVLFDTGEEEEGDR